MEGLNLKAVARKIGCNYVSLRLYVKKYEEELVKRGVLKTQEVFARKKFFVVVPPEEFVKAIREVIREDKKRNGKGKK
jgi:transposase-like protein